MWVSLRGEVTGPVLPRDDHDPRLKPTPCKRFPPYVFSKDRGSLVHHVKSAELDWYIITGRTTVQRAKVPRLILRTHCGLYFSSASKKGQTCQTPAEGALVCRACEKRGRNFPHRLDGRDVDHGVTRHEAKRRIGCAVDAVPET